MGDLGMIQERAGDYEAAAESYRTAVHLAEDAGFSRDPDVTDFRLGAGRALRKAGRLDESEAELRQVLLRIPAHPRAHLELALLMEARGDTADAIEHLQSALAAWENADASFAPAQEGPEQAGGVDRLTGSGARASAVRPRDSSGVRDRVAWDHIARDLARRIYCTR